MGVLYDVFCFAHSSVLGVGRVGQDCSTNKLLCTAPLMLSSYSSVM